MRAKKLNPVVQALPEGLFPDGIAPRLFIAGGYAAHPQRASDIDVWVMCYPTGLEQDRMMLLEHFRQNGVQFETEIAAERFRLDGHGYDEMDVRIIKVARVLTTSHKPIHIMVTDAPSPFALLTNFDVSTHQVALTDSGIQYGPEWTPLEAEPVQLKETSATPARMEKIRTRYADLRGVQS